MNYERGSLKKGRGRGAGSDRGSGTGFPLGNSDLQTLSFRLGEDWDDTPPDPGFGTMHALATPPPRRQPPRQRNTVDEGTGSDSSISGSSYSQPSQLSGVRPRRPGPLAEIRDSQVTYSWKNLSVARKKPCCSFMPKHKFDQKKVIKKSLALLSNVHGVMKPGELTCIMGSSGSGKTVLLDALTFRSSPKLQVNGEQHLNGEPANAKTVGTISGYVRQEPLCFGTLTVREHLLFHAWLRMDPDMTNEVRNDRVDEVIQEFGLSSCAEVVIGIPGRLKGITAGERRRLAVAAEFLTEPSLLFCDEPISGLDSYMAHKVVSALRNQTRRGKTILCTVHEGSSNCFSLFDNLILLAEGRVAYFGPREKALEFLHEQGFPCPAFYNPAEFLTCTLTVKPEKEQESIEVLNSICDSFENSRAYQELHEIIDSNCYKVDGEGSDAESDRSSLGFSKIGCSIPANDSPYKAGWIRQFRVLYWRALIAFMKDPFLLKLKLLQTLIIAFAVGIVYWQVEMNQDGLQNISGCFFFLLLCITYTNCFGVIDEVCNELPIVLREHRKGMYRPDTYYFAKLFAQLPFYLIFPVILTSIAYFMIGLTAEANRWISAVIIILLVTNAVVAFGNLISYVAKKVSIALFVAPIVLLPYILFGGLLLVLSSVPKCLSGFKYLTWFYYGYHTLLITQWTGVEGIECNQFNETCMTNGKMSGDMALADMEVQGEYMEDIIGLGVLVILYQFLGFIAFFFHMTKPS